MLQSVLADHHLLAAVAANYVFTTTGKAEDLRQQIQPASLDLTLSNECWQVAASFLPGKKRTVQKALDQFNAIPLDISGGLLLRPNSILICKLRESFVLPKDMSGTANPKSSTGRLDVFVRLITDLGESFDTVAPGYIGPLYLEIIPRTFAIKIYPGIALNQVRLRTQTTAGYAPGGISSDRFCYVCLDGSNAGGLLGWRAKRYGAPIDLLLEGAYDPLDFWEPLHFRGQTHLVLDPHEFYILASADRIAIPENLSAEMVPFEATTGEFRAHYAGFFDPGFGDLLGCKAVLEVRSLEVPFILEHGQRVARLVYEPLLAKPDVLYGKQRASHYQNQDLKLAKWFMTPSFPEPH